MATKVPEEVAGILMTAAAVEGNVVMLGQTLSRNEYLAVDKVLRALGGKWDKKQNGHVFDVDIDVEALIDEIFETGEYVDNKKETGFFETPKELVEKMIELAEVSEDDVVLEPSAGMGAIADILVEHGCDKKNIKCIEVDYKRYRSLMEKGYSCMNMDFITGNPEHMYGEDFDKVIMNPPFNKGIDVAHVTQAFRFLKEGGKLVAVMSSGIKTNSNKKSVAFRELVDKNGWFEDIPAGTFKKSGTMVNTVLCILNK